VPAFMSMSRLARSRSPWLLVDIVAGGAMFGQERLHGFFEGGLAVGSGGEAELGSVCRGEQEGSQAPPATSNHQASCEFMGQTLLRDDRRAKFLKGCWLAVLNLACGEKIRCTRCEAMSPARSGEATKSRALTCPENAPSVTVQRYSPCFPPPDAGELSHEEHWLPGSATHLHS
jgi:hypothetical protein